MQFAGWLLPLHGVLAAARRLRRRRLGPQRPARARRQRGRGARAVHARRRGRAAGAAGQGVRRDRDGGDGRRLLGRPADRDRRRSARRRLRRARSSSSASARSRRSSPRARAPRGRARRRPGPTAGGAEASCRPSRASRTSVTASGKTVAITARICSACSLVVPCTLTRLIAATVMSTASLIALSAQASDCWPCICSANSAIRRCSSSGSPNRSPKPPMPSMLQSYSCPRSPRGGRGVELAYAEHGAGAPVLLIHGLAGDREALAPLAGEIAGARRRRASSPTTAAATRAAARPSPTAARRSRSRREDAAALLRGARRRARARRGDGFGALVALDLLAAPRRPRARRRPRRPAALRARAARPRASSRAGRSALREAVADATGPPPASRRTWRGRARGRADRERAEAAHAAFFADYAGLASLPVTPPRAARHRTCRWSSSPGPGAHRRRSRRRTRSPELVPGARRVVDGDLAGAVVGT